MWDMLWTSLGLFNSPRDTFEELKKYNTKTLFLNGVFISSLGILSLFLGQMLQNGAVSPHTVFFQIIAYYISSYLFLSVVLMSVSIFRRKINMIQFFGLYLATDLPFLIVLPIALIGKVFPIMMIGVSIFIAMIGLMSWILKIELFMKYFKLSFSQVLVMYFLPIALLIAWGIAMIITIFNNSVALF